MNSDGTADLQGYNNIKISMSVPEGVNFMFFINESGADVPDQGAYNGVRGADGESFASEINAGTGQAKIYTFDLNSFRSRREWGNQNGSKTLNLQAIMTVDIYIPGNSGEGTIEIISILLY